jgi:hypothetical protein
MDRHLHPLIELDTATAERLSARVRLLSLPGHPDLYVVGAPAVPPGIEIAGVYAGELADLA